MIKLATILLGITSFLTATIGVTSGSIIIALFTVVCSLIVVINACFITNYLKHLSDHNKTVQTKADCDSLRQGIQNQLCLIIKHFGIKEDG